MNLKERYELLSQNIPNLFLVITNQPNGNIQLTDLHKFRDTIHSLGTLREFKDDVDTLIINSRLFNSAGDGLVIHSEELSFINSVLTKIKTKAEIINSFFWTRHRIFRRYASNKAT